MIKELTNERRADFAAACRHDHVFGSKALTALAAYGYDSPAARFWVEYADEEPCAALYLAGGVLTLPSDCRAFTRELGAFTVANDVTEVDSCLEQCEALRALMGGTIESSYYMEYTGGTIDADFTGITADARLDEVFSILQRSHQYYRDHLKFEGWSQELSLKLGKGLMELVQLNLDGVPVGTGSIVSQDDETAAIAAVAVIPEYRGRGLGTRISQYLVNRVLALGKRPVLISGYDEVAELYRRVGFCETGRWGELYL